MNDVRHDELTKWKWDGKAKQGGYHEWDIRQRSRSPGENRL